jgi:hypothetical protein
MSRHVARMRRRAGSAAGVVLVAALGAAGPAKTGGTPATPRDSRPLRLVVTQLAVGSAAEKAGAAAGGLLPGHYGDGGRLVLVENGRIVRVLTEGFSSAADPDVSFDGTKILFAGRRNDADRWAIYEMSAAGSELRQVFASPDDLRHPIYLPPLYTLTTDPYKGTDRWEQIAYVRVSSSLVEEGGEGPLASIGSYRVGEPDGTPVRLGHPLSYGLSTATDPALLPDGRILFASRQRATLERGAAGRVALLGMNADGTDPALFSGDEGGRVKLMPCVTEDRLVVFVEGDTVGWDGAGSLGAVSLRRNLHSYRAVTKASDGLFHSPSALEAGRVLAAMQPTDRSGTHGIVAVDVASGRVERIFDDPTRHDIQARRLAARSRADSRSTPIKEGEADAKLYGLNVYLNDLPPGSLPLGSVARLRVLEGVADRVGQEVGAKGLPPLARRRLIGEAPVEPDGSFHVQIPAGVPVQLQILDESGLALRSSGWIWARGKAQQGCVGCHEDGELAPPNRFIDALGKPAASLVLPAEKRRTVDFKHDVAPIVESRCVACHGEGKAIRLDGGVETPGLSGRFSRSYEVLLGSLTPGPKGELVGRYVHPGRARTSPLVWHLLGRNTSRSWDGPFLGAPAVPLPRSQPLTDDEKRILIEWVDLGAMWDATDPVAGEK